MNKMRLMLVVALLALLSTLPTSVFSQTYIVASDDAYVRGGALADNNYNYGWTVPGQALRARWATADTNKRLIFVKFDLRTLTGNIGTAKLSLVLYSAVGDGYDPAASPYPDTLNFHIVDNDSWSENTITWNNAPTKGDVIFRQAFRHHASTAGDTIYTWDMTSIVRSEFAKDSILTLCLAPGTDLYYKPNLNFYSRHSVFKEPTLEISANNDPLVTMIFPNGRERLQGSAITNVRWLSTNVTNVKLDYTLDNGSTWNSIVASTPGSTGTYAWTVPSSPSTVCRVRVTDVDDTTASDVSKNVFEISGTNPPTTLTGIAEHVMTTSARLLGSVDPQDSSATAYFEWGTTDVYGTGTPDISLTTPFTQATVRYNLTGLTPGVTYHFRVVASNRFGTNYGNDQTFTTPTHDNNGWILPTDDAFVRGGLYADSNFNTNWTIAGEALRVRMSTADTNKRHVFMKFDLSNYQGTVQNAKLSMWVSRAQNQHWTALTPYPDTANLFFVPNDNWTESSITMNTAPARGEFLFNQAFLHRTSSQADTMYEWDVTSLVQQEYAGDKKVTFCLADTEATNGTDLRMYSKETVGFEPMLTITFLTPVDNQFELAPRSFSLLQNFPNPFNPSTTLNFSVKTTGKTTLKVYNILGSKVATLVDGVMQAGTLHNVVFDASNLPSGLYIAVLRSNDQTLTQKMSFVK